MSKRKLSPENHTEPTNNSNGTKVAKTNGHVDVKTTTPIIQIITGSYERVLHGVTASIADFSSSKSPSVTFADTFLFNAHASAIRCLALSPLPDVNVSGAQGVLLASGGSDERVNVYSISASPIVESDRMPVMPSFGPHKVMEDPNNRELGSLLQHSSTVTALHFPTRSKLLSASEDNTISISRTKGLVTVSTIKAPRPTALGQPSGDTAPTGAIPAGVNDFAVHPSMKLMVSVGKGEKCMRLWNLVTGKKAGVLNFGRNVLQSVKEGKHSSGEGRRIRWSPDGQEFAVAFERGAVVFGEDSKPKCTALPAPLTKLHQMSYLQISENTETSLLVMSTEDGRVVFFCTGMSKPVQDGQSQIPKDIGECQVVAQLGGRTGGLSGRVKDFEIVQLGESDMAVVAAGSDGAIRIWHVFMEDLKSEEEETASEVRQIGTLLGTYETGSRITCLKAFLMQSPGSEEGLSELEGLREDEKDVESDSESDPEQ